MSTIRSNASIQPAEATLTPFWSRIPKFFLWPMQFDPLVFIGMMTVGMVIASILPMLGWLLALAIWFYFFRYAMTVLVQTARGNFDPAAADLAQEHNDRRPLKQVGFIFIAAAAVLATAHFIGPKSALLLGFVITLVLPAAIIIIAIHDNLADALNPLQLFGVIASIGAPYLLLCLFLMLLEGSDIAVINLLGPIVPKAIAYPITTFFSMYFLLVMYNMMGYVVYQFHESLGYSIDKTFDQNADAEKPKAAAFARQPLPLSPRDQRIADLMNNGDINGAINVLKDDMRLSRSDIADNQKLHKLYLALGENDKTLPHAQELINWLVAANQGAAALDVFMRMRGIDANFNVPDANAVLPLADAAKAKRNAPLAMELIKGFDKKNPNHRDTPAVYFLAAQILSELQRDDVQAMRILQAIVTRHPNANVAKDAGVYLQVLQKTSVPTANIAATKNN